MAYWLLVMWFGAAFALGDGGNAGNPWVHAFYWLMPTCAVALWLIAGWLLVRLPNVIVAITITVTPAFVCSYRADRFEANLFLLVTAVYLLAISISALGALMRFIVHRRRQAAA
jgi:hypothetical protein